MTEAMERCNNSCKTTCLQIIVEDHHKDGMAEKGNNTPGRFRETPARTSPPAKAWGTKGMLLCYSRSAPFQTDGEISVKLVQLALRGSPAGAHLRERTPQCWKLQVFASKRTEMHPYTLLIHWMLKLALCFEASNACRH